MRLVIVNSSCSFQSSQKQKVISFMWKARYGTQPCAIFGKTTILFFNYLKRGFDAFQWSMAYKLFFHSLACSHWYVSFQQENLLGAEWRGVKGQSLASGNGSRQPSRKRPVDSNSPCDSKSTEASTSMSVDELCAADSTSLPSTSRADEVLIKIRQIWHSYWFNLFIEWNL